MFRLDLVPTPPKAAGMHLAPLDGARGLAVLLVLLDHASDQGMRLFPGADLNRTGKYGVYLFFVLSAFLLTSQFYARPRDELVRISTWISYAARRFLRVFPVYIVVLLAMIAMDELRPSDLGTHLLLRNGKGVYWTIPVEVKYYLLLPLVVLTLFWAGRKHWTFGLAAAAATAFLCFGFFRFENFWSLHETVLLAPNLAPFLMGSATAVAYGALQRRPAAAGRWSIWLQAAAIMGVLLLLFRIPALYNFIASPLKRVGKFAYDPIVCGAIWSLFILGILQGKGWLAHAMGWRPLRFLGLISFSAYLWHAKFVSDVDDLPVPPLLRLLTFLAIVIAVATASYFLLERPLSKIRPGKRPAVSPAPLLRD